MKGVDVNKNRMIIRIVLMGVSCSLLPLSAQTFRYSTDLGSDLDLSDSVTTGNNWMDCGDIYIEGIPNPTLIKNDDTGNPNTGYPVTGGNQPLPTLIGAGSAASASQVRTTYDTYYDVDGEDQLELEVLGQEGLLTQYDPTMREILKIQGVHFMPTKVHISYDDDTAPGWYKSGSIPTTTAPSYGTTANHDEILSRTGVFGNWVNETGVRDEVALGLGANPDMEEAFDDDVDALDEEQHRFYYWTADHEANLGYDPGSIYMTDLNGSGQNATLAFDDALHLGLPQDTDVDAFEFTLVDEATYQSYGFAPVGIIPGEDVLMMRFSVDQNDLDNDMLPVTDIHGDESGGLNPHTLYISNLAGEYKPLQTFNDDIDAISVPEPATILLLGIGAGVAWLARIKQRLG